MSIEVRTTIAIKEELENTTHSVNHTPFEIHFEKEGERLMMWCGDHKVSLLPQDMIDMLKHLNCYRS